MTAKIFDIFTGEEIKGPKSPACDKRTSAKRTRVVTTSGERGFEQIGEVAARVMRRLEAR